MDLSKTKLVESVFAGGGEMAALMRTFDWSTTPIGPLEQWPQSLRTCVRIMLGSGYPMMISWGPDYTILYNDAWRPVQGAKHPALGRSCREVWSELWDFAGPMFDRVMTQGQDYSTLTDELHPLYRNGYLEECYFAFSWSPIPDDTGGVGGVMTTALETTARVIEDRRQRVLRDLASRTAETRDAEQVWRISAETLAEHRLSAPFAFLYGYRPSAHQAYLTAASVETEGALRPQVVDCRSENLWQFDPAMTRNGVVVGLGNHALAVSVPNWQAPAKEASVVPIRLGKHSEAMGFLVVGIHPGCAFNDPYRQFVNQVAEQIAIGLASASAYEQERQRAEALAELDRAKTAFFSNVSHEFRTPLTLMLGPLEEVLTQTREQLGPEAQGQLETVRRNALRLLKLVNTLLDFSRIEAGRVRAVYEPTDLAGATSEIASVFRSAMENAGLRFSVDCEPIPEPVYVDRDMWEKVVLNLLSNAFKFTFEGEVAVTLKPVDGAVELRVRDTGAGIAEEERERVFERFHRIGSVQARTHEGTGIGLALVQELVKMHGGTVQVEGTLGQGSTFTVTIPAGKAHLPAERIQAERTLVPTEVLPDGYAEEAQRWLPTKSGAAVDAPALTEPVSLAPSPQPEPASKRELIVIADDNADMRQYLKRLLGDQYDVHAVADGSEALEAARQLHPVLVLADIMMPRLDGFGMLRAIRDDSALCNMPVILVSARAGEESRLEGLQADADDYLVKPFTARELQARMATLVKMANLRREIAEREERLRSQAELKRSEAFLAEGQRLSRTGSFSWCAETTQVTCSDEIYRIFEFEHDVPVTLGLITNRIHPEDLQLLSERFEQVRGAASDFEHEHRLLMPDKSVRYVRWIAHGTRDQQGRVEYFGAVQDVTQRRLSEEALAQARSELENVSSAASLGMLTASIAHEVSQPLSGIITNASTCLRMLDGDPPNVDVARETARRIVRDGNRASDVITRLRDLFSKKEFTLETMDLNEATREVVALSLSDLQRNRVILRSEFAEDLPPIAGDRVQLQQVILNLLRNASDAMLGVEDRPRQLLIKTERDDVDRVRVSVRDAGVGVNRQSMDKLFDPFYTTKSGGMGIGLSVSRSIIERHHGRLWAEPNDGPGLTLSFSIPGVQKSRASFA